jgi:hypothetical protein
MASRTSRVCEDLHLRLLQSQVPAVGITVDRYTTPQLIRDGSLGTRHVTDLVISPHYFPSLKPEALTS